MNAYEIMGNYETAKKYIYPCFVGMNEKIDADFHVVFDNSTRNVPKICFRMITDFGNGHFGSAIVSNKVLEDWGVTREEFVRDCLNGCEDRSSIEALDKVIGVSGDADQSHLYVVTNDTGYYGAGMIACPQVREILYDMLKTDSLIVLPSSIHEVIVMPKDLLGENLSIETINDTIKSINKTELKTEDILLDYAWEEHHDSEATD